MSSAERREARGGVGAGVAIALVLAGCGGAGTSAPGPAEPQVPARAATVGDVLLDQVPAGAQLVVELDLTRLRANEAVGPLMRELAAAPDEGQLLGLAGVFAGDVDSVLMASYALGQAEAATLTLVRGRALPDLPGARRLENELLALGPPALLDRVEAVRGGHEPAAAADAHLQAVRAAGMPAQAEGAAVRLTMVLDFDARVSLASQLAMDSVPAAVSLWGDVADDLALVLVAAAETGEGPRLVRALDRLRARVRAEPGVPPLVRRLLGDVRIEGNDDGARATFVLGPKRLEKLVRLILSDLRKNRPS